MHGTFWELEAVTWYPVYAVALTVCGLVLSNLVHSESSGTANARHSFTIARQPERWLQKIVGDERAFP